MRLSSEHSVVPPAHAFGVDQLSGDANAVLAASYAAFEHVADPKLASDLANIDGPALILEALIASYHEQLAESRQFRSDIFDDAISKVLLTRITVQIGEGKNGD